MSAASAGDTRGTLISIRARRADTSNAGRRVSGSCARGIAVGYCKHHTNMARGFDSKDVEFQQAEAARTPPKRRTLTGEERDQAARRLTIELSLAHARDELAVARSDAHRRMLESAIDHLRQQLGAGTRNSER